MKTTQIELTDMEVSHIDLALENRVEELKALCQRHPNANDLALLLDEARATRELVRQSFRNLVGPA